MCSLSSYHQHESERMCALLGWLSFVSARDVSFSALYTQYCETHLAIVYVHPTAWPSDESANDRDCTTRHAHQAVRLLVVAVAIIADVSCWASRPETRMANHVY